MASARAKGTEKSQLVVYLKDLSGSGNEPEAVGGFKTDTDALAFARAYVCDSVERCRIADAVGKPVLESWKLFGEDTEVFKGDALVWTSEEDIKQFVKAKSQDQERNWRVLDPRHKSNIVDFDGCDCGHEHVCEHEDDHEHEVFENDDNNLMVGL